MRLFILNFPRTTTQDLKTTLNLPSLFSALFGSNTSQECANDNDQLVIEEFFIDDFFGESMQRALECIDHAKKQNQPIHIYGIAYPAQSQKDQQTIINFIQDSLQSKDNLYFYPKPNYYVEVDDFALFYLCEHFTFQNYEIERLYRNQKLSKTSRNFTHQAIRQSLNIPQSIISKKFFPESRKLFNLSWKWREYQINEQTLHNDLLNKIPIFYKAPQTIGISITNACNLACIMCHYHSPKYKPTQTTDFFQTKLSLEDCYVHQAIDYAIANGCVIDFTSPGEALLDKRIYSFIRYASGGGAKGIGLTSNATLLTKPRAKELIESGITYIRFSVDGATSETYRKIRGTDLEQVEQNIQFFILEAHRQKRNIEINLNCVLTQEAKHETKLYMQKWKPFLPYINYISFSNEIIGNASGFHTTTMPKDRYICHWPWTNGMYIAPNGMVTICCAMQMTYGRAEVHVGNIKQQSLEEIWTSQAMQNLRQANLKKDFSSYRICASCIEWANNKMDNEGINRENGIVLRQD